MKPVEGRITLQVLMDRPLLEICGNDGRVFLTAERLHRGPFDSVSAFVEGGVATLVEFQVHELKSIWK